MTITSRATWALSLGILGAAVLAAPLAAQQKPPPEKPAPATVACVDLGAIMKGYDKFKEISETIKAEGLARKKQLDDIRLRGQQVGREMQSLAIGSAEYKLKDNELTKLQAELSAEGEKAQREFAQKEAESMATVYKEVQACVARVAQFLSYTHVLQVSNEPVNGANPDAAMAAWGRSVIYHDPKSDITEIVLYNLNGEYNKARGARPAAGAPGSTTPPSSSAPAAKTAARTPASGTATGGTP